MSNIVVLFEVTPTEAGKQRYLDLAAMLHTQLEGFEGFVRAERFRSLNNGDKLLSMNVWTDEAAVERWRNVMQHRMSQREGREKLFISYNITVCSVLREYTVTDRAQAPADSNSHFAWHPASAPTRPMTAPAAQNAFLRRRRLHGGCGTCATRPAAADGCPCPAGGRQGRAGRP